MTIEVIAREDDKVFYTTVSGDSMAGELREFFEDYRQVFEQLAEGNFELQGPSRLILLVKIARKIKRLPMHLTQKVLTKQMMLEKKVAELQKQNHRLRGVERDNKELHIIIQEMKQKMTRKQKELNEKDAEINCLVADFEKLNHQLKGEIYDLNNKIDELRLRNSQLEEQRIELQKQLQSTNKKLLLKQEAMKQAKRMKAQTISGQGYEELYYNIVQTKDKSQITDLCLQNTIDYHRGSREQIGKIADEIIKFSSVRSFTFCFQHNLYAHEVFDKLANNINLSLTELHTITLKIPKFWKQHEKSPNWTQKLKIKPIVEYY